MRSVLSAIVVILGTLGCGGSLTDPWPNVVTDAESPVWYAEESIWSVPFSVRNLSSRDTYYLSACDDRIMAGVDRSVRGRWTEHLGAYCIAVLPMVSVALAPGETLRSHVAIRASGTYRIRLGVSASREDPEEWTETSDSFVISGGG